MKTLPKPAHDNGYPTYAREPMPETDWHRDLMVNLIMSLRFYFASIKRVAYVSGNILVFYERGYKRRHVSPDVFVARGVAQHDRPNYLIWEEARGPEFVIELTSSTTRRNDQVTKMRLYRETLKVREYFLFDPLDEYLTPRFQGYRLRGEEYVPIRPRDGRLPSQVTGLHLEPHGSELRLWNPATGAWVPTEPERREQAEERIRQLEAELARRNGTR
jgi:Uma2 family endonuclease